MTMPFESTMFRRIIEEYTDWPKWARFTSILHHMAIFDITSMKLEDTECKISSYGPETDRTDIWIRSEVVNGMFEILSLSNTEAVPRHIIEILMELLCETISEFAADPDAPLKDPLTWTSTEMPPLPLQTLPQRPQVGEVDFVNSAFRKLVEKAWNEVMCIKSEEFHSKDTNVTADTAFFEVWGNMLAAQQFAEFYSDHSIGVLMEDIIEYPTMRGQVFLLQKKHNSKGEDGVGSK